MRDRVLHLVADFRLEYVSSHLKELNARLLQVKDSEEMQEVMGEIMRTQNLRNELAKKMVVIFLYDEYNKKLIQTIT